MFGVLPNWQRYRVRKRRGLPFYFVVDLVRNWVVSQDDLTLEEAKEARKELLAVCDVHDH
jgi:hypothetical protein